MAILSSTDMYGDLNIRGNNIKAVGKINKVTADQLSFLEGSTSNIQEQVDNINRNKVGKNNDTLETYTEKLVTIGGTSIINLEEGNVFVDTPTSDRSYTIANAKEGVAHSFTLQVNMGSTVRKFNFPSSVRWQSGKEPELIETNKIYLLTFMTTDGGSTWLGMFGGEF